MIRSLVNKFVDSMLKQLVEVIVNGGDHIADCVKRISDRFESWLRSSAPQTLDLNFRELAALIVVVGESSAGCSETGSQHTTTMIGQS
jgi:hypothetical protein